MASPFTTFLLSLLIFFTNLSFLQAISELQALIDIKSALDPESKHLSSWTINGDPCGGSFDGIGCNENGQVANISLQGKKLSGNLSPAIGELKSLTGLFLHYNSLSGEIPSELVYLTDLNDLYLNMNNFSGEIPPEIGTMKNLQVLQLCYNQFSGSIPAQLGSLKKLTVVTLQSNQLTGAIPASLGELSNLMRLDLSYNNFFGSIPTKLADAPVLQVFDVRNNSLSGNVPLALKRLNEGFLFENNPNLCGSGFSSLRACNASDPVNPRPEPFGPDATGLPREKPETANVPLSCNQTMCNNSKSSKTREGSVVVGMVVLAVAISAIVTLTFTQYRRRKLETKFGTSDGSLSTENVKVPYRRHGSPLISLEYGNGWDPLADGKSISGFGQDVFHSFRFNLEEVETATQYFSELNLLGKSPYSTTYKGILRDGSVVAVKCIGKTSCKSEESEFLKGLNMLASLRHENLVRLRGFCCSKARGECFLIYDFIPNGNLLNYLDVTDAEDHVLEWSTRVSIIKGIAKGIAYLHAYKVNKPALVHQNLSAEKVLIDQRLNPLLSDSGLRNLLTNDIVFYSVKANAALGYLAPEYASTGRFTEKSDVYAFGVLVFQLLSGKRDVTSLVRPGADSCRFQDFIDSNLREKFFEYEVAKFTQIAFLCTHESPIERPSMQAVVQELGNCSSCL